MAISAPTPPSRLPTPSRAGSLLQGLRLAAMAAVTTDQMWERACSRWPYQPQHHRCGCQCHREQAHPYRGLWLTAAAALAAKPMWSEPARDGYFSPNFSVEAADGIASRITPTGIAVGCSSRGHHRPNVGASLLAMAISVPTSPVRLPIPSRASSLPQGSVVDRSCCARRKSNVGVSLLAMAIRPQLLGRGCRRHREQAHSYRGCGWMQ
ncbi:hypothetical protein SAMN05216222_5356 [Pseudomonas prosekii]|uniref:Uncharacterized protein n=1 Tax=Pseudomonas prosekii TaxID=1148509 RepID=A0A1H2BPB3_9PSED|nr:hypothetical protein SAMN05216222_5356 [Pseudomonas prosekii]